MTDTSWAEIVQTIPAAGALSVEQEATRIIREQAAGRAVSDTRPDARHILLPRAADYVHPFDHVYYPPSEQKLDVGMITAILGAAIGEESFRSLVDELAASKGLRNMLNIIKGGGRVATLGAHRELFDTCAMEAGVLVAAHRLEPEMLPQLIEGGRIFVGPIMAELALQSLSSENSTVEALRYLGGVFKAFPDTESTKQNIRDGLDAKLVMSTNFHMAKEFMRQVRSGAIKWVAVSPSGATDKLQCRADGEGQEYVLQPASDGTAKLIRSFDWWPIVMQLTPQPVWRIGKIIPVSPSRDTHKVMAEDMVALCCELNANEGIPTRYAGQRKTESDANR
jgi:hypothetical protein